MTSILDLTESDLSRVDWQQEEQLRMRTKMSTSNENRGLNIQEVF